MNPLSVIVLKVLPDIISIILALFIGKFAWLKAKGLTLAFFIVLPEYYSMIHAKIKTLIRLRRHLN